jgi:hypothetical protein
MGRKRRHKARIYTFTVLRDARAGFLQYNVKPMGNLPHVNHVGWVEHEKKRQARGP